VSFSCECRIVRMYFNPVKPDLLTWNEVFHSHSDFVTLHGNENLNLHSQWMKRSHRIFINLQQFEVIEVFDKLEVAASKSTGTSCR
jgi:hypothetical protein